ncbi:MAG: type II toxin-antitoxin system MqsA family antitoxin [Chloroflexota bacterium]|nr:type II toxin-antitoxin system MqsA family antitoxin [Chloroflexota bacterium]
MSKQSFDCHFCGGKVTAKQVNIMRHWQGRYILIENIPAHVCTQCGERYYDGVVAEAMDRIMRASESEFPVKREICVPVVEMPLTYSIPQQAGPTIRDKPSE